MDGAEDAQELVVVDVLGEVQRERGIEVIRMPHAEVDHVGAVERAVGDTPYIPPAFRLTHKRFGEIDADVLTDAGAHELEQHAVATPKVGHDLLAGQLEERQHAPHPLDRVGIVLVDIALIVDGLQLFFRLAIRLVHGHFLARTGRFPVLVRPPESRIAVRRLRNAASISS